MVVSGQPDAAKADPPFALALAAKPKPNPTNQLRSRQQEPTTPGGSQRAASDIAAVNERASQTQHRPSTTKTTQGGAFPVCRPSCSSRFLLSLSSSFAPVCIRSRQQTDQERKEEATRAKEKERRVIEGRSRVSERGLSSLFVAFCARAQLSRDDEWAEGVLMLEEAEQPW